ncbi:MAG TPA: phosphoribosylformylglycinamidine cyclo-ligase [Polyangia bacterium]|nr:phosphoribosylformylglycinamidine cyclo-ligase [Polyangia bacterium]
MQYRDAGVDIDAGAALVERIKKLAGATARPEVLTALGGFAGAVAIPPGLREPILVSSTDGVGTKLKIAFATGRHDTIGIDLVAMNADDVAVTGAEPLFFLDYFACGRLEVGVAEQVIRGIADGCRLAGCALVGGETAELPGMYADGEYDLAGFCVGVADKARFVDGRAIEAGDRVLGLASSGLHSNGYALARKVLLERMGLALEKDVPELGCTLAEELLRPTRIYARSLVALARADLLRGAAHITGGGLIDNPPRMLPPGLAIRLDLRTWEVPAVFRLIAAGGPVDQREMLRTFNLGLGMVVAVPRAAADRARRQLEALGERVIDAGEIIEKRGDAVEIVP